MNAVRQDLTRVCAKVQTMRNLEGHETHRLKIRAPTESAIQHLRERDEIEIARPDREMLQYVQDGTAFLEVELKFKPMQGVRVPSFYVHGHLKKSVDVTKGEFWKTLGANDFTRVHVKMNASRKWGSEQETQMMQAGTRMNVYRCDIPKKWLTSWLKRV